MKTFTQFDMKKIISVLFALAVIFGGANVDAKTAKKSTGKRKTTTASAQGITKGAVTSYGDYLKTQKFTIKKGKDSKIEVEYPIGGNPSLVKSIRNYIKDCLNMQYKGSLETPDGLLHSAMKGVGREYMYNSDTKVIYSNPKLITFETIGEDYAGGAHGMYWNVSATFIVENGQHFDTSMLPDFDEMEDYILEALAQDRETTVDDIIDSFYDVNALEDYDIVFITEDGLNVFYQVYGLGPFSSGAYHGVIPWDEIYDLLPEATKKLVK